MEHYYKIDEVIQKYSKVGSVMINPEGVVMVEPFVEHRIEVMVDPSVGEDVELEEIPPHLKTTIDLYFYNVDSIYPTKGMVACFEPGKLKKWLGKAWIEVPYTEDWKNWESDISDMDKINYPFTVMPHASVYPKTIKMINNDVMKVLSTIKDIGRRQITIQEFEKLWVHLFDPRKHDPNDWPISAWLHIAETPNSYVDVIEVNPDKSYKVLFTVPPLLSLNNDRNNSSIMKETVNINYTNMAMRASEESNRIPESGNDRIRATLNNTLAEPEHLNEHIKMWEIIGKRYGFSLFTDPENNTGEVNAQEKYSDEESDITLLDIE